MEKKTTSKPVRRKTRPTLKDEGCNMAQIQENIDKFKELVLYISQKCADDPSFGSVKLNKILFFADFSSFAHYGVPVTGVPYQHLERGPGPKYMVPIREQMIKAGELGIQEKAIGAGVQKKPVNLREPNLDLFGAKEIALVDSIIVALAAHTAKSTSELSHLMCAWKFTRMGDTIPYGSVFLTDCHLNPSDIARGQELAREYSLLEAPAP